MRKASTKLFRKVLFTASTAALMLGSSGVLAGSTIDGNAQFSTSANMTTAEVPYAGGDTLTYKYDARVDADVAVTITAINVNGYAPALFEVNENITLGSVNLNGGTAFPIGISDTFTLTLNGTDGAGLGANTYDGLDTISLNGATAGLTINAAGPVTLDGTINGFDTNEGILTVSSETTFTALIGGVEPIAQAIFNAKTTLGDAIQAQNISIGAAEVEVTGLVGVSGTVDFTGDGKLTVNAGITGNVTTVGNNGTLIVSDGNIRNVGAAGVNLLKNVTFNNTKASSAGAIYATDIAIGAGTADVTAKGTITGAVDFAADGQLTVENGIVGAVTSSVGGGTGGKLIIAGNSVLTAAGGTIGANIGVAGNILTSVTFKTGANGGPDYAGAIPSLVGNIFATTVTIDADGNAVASKASTGAIAGNVVFAVDGQLTVNGEITGAVTTGANDTGTLIVTAGNVGGAIGVNAGNVLKKVTFNGTSNVTTVDATNVSVGAGANVTAAGLVTAAVQFTGAGQLTVNNGIVGAAVTTTGGGTLNIGKGSVLTAGGLIGANIGAVGNALTAVTFNTGANGGPDYAGAIPSLVGNIFATIVTIGADGNGVASKASAGTINGGVSFTAAGQLTTSGLITGNVNFATDGTLIANDGIDGAVTAANGAGTLTTPGNVTGAIGTKTASIKVLNANVDNADTITFGRDIYAATVNFASVAGGGANVGTIQVGGNLVATTINFANVGLAAGDGGILEFNGGGNYKLKGTINNGAKAILNITDSGVIADHPTIGTVAKINVGDNTNPAFLEIDSSSANIDILNNGQNIILKNADSALIFFNGDLVNDRVITLYDHLPGFATGGGELYLIGGTKKLTLQGDGGNKTIGTAGNGLKSLNVQGNVTLNNIDTTNVAEFNILGTTQFVNVGDINQILIINIGAADPSVGVDAAGAGSYVIDANGAGVNILAAANSAINFKHVDAKLILQNSSTAADGTITLGASLDPGALDTGILELNSVDANKTLILAAGAAGVTIGTKDNKLKGLIFTGAGKFNTAAVKIFADNLGVNVTAPIDLGEISDNLTFGAAGQVTQKGNIGGYVDFGGKDATLTLNGGVNIGGVVKNTGGANNGTIEAKGASTIAGAITGLKLLKVGAGDVTITNGGDNSITEIQGTGTNTLRLLANFNLTGGINLTGGTALKLNFANGGSVSGAVGTAANPVGDMTTAGTTKFTGSVAAKGNMTFGGTTSFASTFTNTGTLNASGTTTFTGAFSNNGATSFAGTTSFADTFNNTGTVTLAKDSTTNFAKDVTATSFVADGATLSFGSSLAFNSDITGSGTTLTLNTNQISYTGKGSFTDTLTINTTFAADAKSGGNILIKSGSTLDLSKVSNLAVIIDASSINIDNIDENSQFKLVSAETAGGLTPAPSANVKVTIKDNPNRFVGFTIDTSSLTLLAKDITEDVIEEDFAPDGPLANIPNADNLKKSLELMAQAPDGSDADNALKNWGKLTPDQLVDAENKVLPNIVKPSETISAITTAVMGGISSNLTTLNTRMDRVQAANNSAAVAAGDEDESTKLGAWINPFIGNATQKKKQNISGYKLDSTGGTIGFDGLVNDNVVLGLAYTRADTDIKLKDSKSGDKTKVRSNIYSLYGLYNLPANNLFVEGVVSYGDSKVRSKSKRIIAVAQNTIGYQTATGNYKSENYTGQLMVGYNYIVPEQNINLTPLAGLKYASIKDKGYKETGTTYQNLIVKGKNYNTFDGLLGGRVSSDIKLGEVTLTPELYAIVDYAFKNKAPAIDARLQGMPAPYPTNSFKPSKTSFDIGAGISIKHKMMEYGINYDTNIASKYFAQQGSLKVRVNF